MTDQGRLFKRMLQRSAFQSLFWVVLLARKRDEKLSRKGLADRLGVHKSFVSRAFSRPPNWQSDKISDLADALNVDLVIQARDRKTGMIYTPAGEQVPARTSSSLSEVRQVQTGTNTTTNSWSSN